MPQASADVSPPGNGAQPVRVALSIYLLDLDGIDNVNQNYEANVFYMASWNDPRLAHSGTGEISRHLDEVWHPRLLFLNQQRTWKTFPEVVKIDPQGNVNYRQRLWGYFLSPWICVTSLSTLSNFRFLSLPQGTLRRRLS